MLTASKKRKQKNFEFMTLDIETDSKGHYTDFGLYDGETFYHTNSLDKVVRFILKRGGIYYAHCGMRFDYVIIIKELMKYQQFNISFAGTQGICIMNDNVKFYDSYRLLPGKLEDLCNSFDVSVKKIKLDVMPWELSADDRIEYLKCDCISLHEVITNFWSLIDTNFGNYRSITLPALALKIWTDTLEYPFMVSKSKKLVDFESKSYYGGMCWIDDLIIRQETKVTVYDVNSMYPFMMRKYKYPYSYIGAWTSEFDVNRIGLYKVRANYDGIPFCYDIDTKQLSNDGTFIVDNETVQYLMDIGNCSVEYGYIYYNCDYIFREFVDRGYKLRKLGLPGLSYVAKIMLNSLYGKFGEKPIKRTVSNVLPESYINCRIYDSGEVELFDYTTECDIKHRFVAISALVTLRARLHLRKLSQQGILIYCDTDSLHFLGTNIQLPVDTELGGIKLEYRGKAVYIGKKIYQFDGVTKCKGVPNKCVEFLDFSNLDSELRLTFNSFTSIIDVCSKDKTFELITKTRTVR